MPIYLHTQNILETSAVSHAGTAISDAPVTRLYDRAIDFIWTASFTGDFFVTADQGAISSAWRGVQFCRVAHHSFSGMTVHIQYSDNGSSWTDAVSPAVATDEDINFLAAAESTHRYWRVYVPGISSDPMAGEIFIGNSTRIPVQKTGGIPRQDVDNVTWHRTFGGGERSVKYGPMRRSRTYQIILRGQEITDFNTAMADLSDYLYPFFLTDHRGEVFFCRLSAPPPVVDDDVSFLSGKIDLVEVL